MKVGSKSFKRSFCTGLAVVLATAATAVGYKPLRAETYTVDKTLQEYNALAQAKNVEIMEEGIVLLKNDDALPLADSEKISVLGAGSYFTYWGEASANKEGKYCYVSDSLKDAGFSVNPDTEAFYKSNVTKATVSPAGVTSGLTVYLDPEASALDGIKSSLADYGDAAIITISRSCKEAIDLVTNKTDLDANGLDLNAEHQLALYKNEKELIKFAKQNFGKVIVLLNTATIAQIPELNESGGEYEADAVLYVGLPGQYGLRALGSVLNGEVSPSGRTADTWYSDFTLDPTFKNFGSATGAMPVITIDTKGEQTVETVGAVEYEEGIYLGYKYYETAYAEIAAGNYTPAGYTLNGATNKDKADDWYSQAVTYPFGYGLSYASFTQSFVAGQSVDLAGKAFDDYIELKVNVVNNSAEYTGKDVVQIYSHSDYDGGIEKPEVTLAGFAKSGVLQKGGSETVTVSIRVGDLASYDYNDLNDNGWYGYEIEKGTLQLRLQSDSHTVIDTIEVEIDETIRFDNDGKLAVAATNTVNDTVFSRGDEFDTTAAVSQGNGGSFKTMSRSDFAGTFPTPPASDTEYKDPLPATYNSAFTPDMDKETDPWYVGADEIPDGWTQGANTTYKLFDMAGIDYTSDEVIHGGAFDGKTGKQAWTEFMNQLTWDEITALTNNGNFGSVAVPSVNKIAEYAQNGPEQLGATGTSWACANIMAGTYNTVLLEERGVLMADEALYNGIQSWYGPTGNINRSPFGGRNNIYYSEDALLAGKVTAALIRGAQSRGVIAYVKHFALNEQETGRHALSTWVNEQALRENYLKAFEYAVKDGGTLGIMQSLNKIGGVNGFGNYALDVEVLRNEWGFKGALVTDAYNASLVRENMAQRVGGDMPLGSWKVAGSWDADNNTVTYNGAASPTQWYVIRNSAMHVLYMNANSSVTVNGYNLAPFTTQSFYAAGESKLTLYVGKEFTLNTGVDGSVVGTDKLVYSAVDLPAGLSIDPNTGVISGTPTAASEKVTGTLITVTIAVTEEGNEWIHASVTARLYVEEASAADGEGEANKPSGGAPDAGVIAGVSVAAAVVVLAGVVVLVIFLRKKKLGGAGEKTGADTDTDKNTDTDKE